MNWRLKAVIMAACAAAPGGEGVYRRIQRTFGGLKPRPRSRMEVAKQLERWLSVHAALQGKTVLEVGTGHMPIVPLGLHLLGAARVLTYDLHRRLAERETNDSLRVVAKSRDEYLDLLCEGLTETETAEVASRLEALARVVDRGGDLLGAAMIDYQAPADAARTGLPAGSIDVHVSNTTLEHVPADVIEAIFVEAARVLAPGGVAIHFVDPSDHFQHQDAGIPRIHFLRYSEAQWRRRGGNQFAYCNRLRLSDYLALWERLGWKVVRLETDIDPGSLAALDAGFVPHADFAGYEREDLCTTGFRVLLGRPD